MTLRGTLGRSLGVAALLAVLAGCGGKQSVAGVPPATIGNPATSIPGAPALGPSAGIPFPDDRSAAGLTETTILGKDAEQRSSGATELNTSIVLDATAPSSPAQFAVYRFAPSAGTQHSVAAVMNFELTTSAFLGLANFTTGRWEFFGPFSDAAQFSRVLTEKDSVSTQGNVYVAVLATSGERAVVDALSLTSAGNFPPVAVLNLDKSYGQLPLTVNFSAGTDPGPGETNDHIVSYEWDFDGDGTYDETTTTNQTSHAYTQWGMVEPGLRVTDAGGLQALTTGQVMPGIQRAASASGSYYVALAEVDGNPALFFHNSSGQVFMRANDPTGASWADPVVIDNDPCSAGAMAIVNSKPAVSYLRPGGLFFRSAQDAQGATWNAPVILDPIATLSGRNVDLVCTASGPVVSYWVWHENPSFLSELRFVHAVDSAGTAWASPQVLDSQGNDAASPSLAIVDDKPAIAYYGIGGVLFTRADDALGLTWQAPVVAVSDPEVYFGIFPSLNIVDGKPMIAYYDGPWLSSVSASDVNGTAWEIPTAIRLGYAGGSWDISFAVINGIPALMTDRLSYTSANDALGQSWGLPTTLAGGRSPSLAPIAGGGGVAFLLNQDVYYASVP